MFVVVFLCFWSSFLLLDTLTILFKLLNYNDFIFHFKVSRSVYFERYLRFRDRIVIVIKSVNAIYFSVLSLTSSS